MKKYGLVASNIGDEGGFTPPIFYAEEALDLIMEAIHESGHHDSQVKIGIDCAANEFYIPEEKKYNLDFKSSAPAEASEKSRVYSVEELSQLYENLCRKYPIISIEDPFFEDDWASFAGLLKACPEFHCLQIVGDDLLATT